MFDFGLRIRELRESRHMSQESLGRRIGRSKPVISNYENNIKYPPLEVLISIANVFNVSLDYLVGIEKKDALYINNLNEKYTGKTGYALGNAEFADGKVTMSPQSFALVEIDG